MAETERSLVQRLIARKTDELVSEICHTVVQGMGTAALQAPGPFLHAVCKHQACRMALPPSPPQESLVKRVQTAKAELRRSQEFDYGEAGRGADASTLVQ